MSHELPDPAEPAPNLSPERGFTAQDLIDQQTRLEAQANEAIPFRFDECTYSLGYIRQPVYACRTCGGGGVCAGCSVACHGDHELVELFHRRHFRCDCGTPNLYRKRKHETMATTGFPRGAQPCKLRARDAHGGFDVANDENRYTRNFDGHFCVCERGEHYDPERENETMFQCLVCEEWLHASCTALQPRAKPGARALARPLVDLDAFDRMICDACVSKHDVIAEYAGTRGWILVQRASEDAAPTATEQGPRSWDALPATERTPPDGGRWRIFGLPSSGAQEDTQTKPSTSGAKRRHAEGSPVPPGAKRARGPDRGAEPEPEANAAEAQPAADSGAGAQPTHPEHVHPAVVSRREQRSDDRVDVFLTEDFRERVCRCDACRKRWEALPFVVEEEESYDPPMDPEAEADADETASGTSTASTYDRALAALGQLPRDRMINSLHAYQGLRDALYEHLRPFATSHEPVSAEDVRAFFRDYEARHKR